MSIQGTRKIARERRPAQIKADNLPTAWDWREHNAVTPVKN
jgi:hypothetical protein